MKPYFNYISAMVLGLGLTGICLAQPGYTYTVLPQPPDTQGFTFTSLSDDGTTGVGGGYVNAGEGIKLYQCFTYAKGTFTVLPTPSANCSPTSANKNGDFGVNLYLPGELTPHPFLYHDGFVALDGVLPNAAGQNFAWLQGINDQGQIVGSTLNLQLSPPSIGGNTGKYSGFVYSGGQTTQLPTLGVGDYNMAYAINNNGDAVGFSNSSVFSFANPHPSTWHAVLYPHDGGIVDLGTAGGDTSEAHFINTPGQVAGRSLFLPASGNTNYPRAFLYDQGVMSLLPTPGVSSDVTGLNDNSEVVGVYQNANDTANHPFYYRNGLIMDLNQMVPGLPTDMVVGTPTSITNSGQIVAFAQQAGVASQILLTPIPVPVQ
jgi:uncharacterized membrane protein